MVHNHFMTVLLRSQNQYREFEIGFRSKKYSDLLLYTYCCIVSKKIYIDTSTSYLYFLLMFINKILSDPNPSLTSACQR